MMTLVIQEMSKEFPTLMETLLHERDQSVLCSLTLSMQFVVEIILMVSIHLFFFSFCYASRYMSSSLQKIASEHSSVVAVVGKGHVNGIKKHWKQPVLVGYITFSLALYHSFHSIRQGNQILQLSS